MTARKSPKPAPYHRLSIAEKLAEHRNRQREPAVACPYCETKTTVDDLLVHVEERCEGRREPHPRSRWVTWSQALELGVPRMSLQRWASSGRVATDGERGQRRYLLRDVVKLLAARRASHESVTDQEVRPESRPKARNRVSHKSVTGRKLQAKPQAKLKATHLTQNRREDPNLTMQSVRPLDRTVNDQLNALATELGGVEAVSRRLDISACTLRAALAGKNLRRGTRLLIERQLDAVGHEGGQ